MRLLASRQPRCPSLESATARDNASHFCNPSRKIQHQACIQSSFCQNIFRARCELTESNAENTSPRMGILQLRRDVCLPRAKGSVCQISPGYPTREYHCHKTSQAPAHDLELIPVALSTGNIIPETPKYTRIPDIYCMINTADPDRFRSFLSEVLR